MSISAFLFFAVLLGLAFGSFGNVVVLRMIAGESLKGRSRCPGCKRELSAFELIPIVSFAMQGGRCRNPKCRSHISWQYPLVEAGSAVLFALAFWNESFVIVPSLLLGLALWLLLLIAIMDAKTRSIYDALSIPFVIIAVAYSIVTGVVPWIAVLIAGGFLGLQWIVSRGKWVGSGDIILAAGIGALARTPGNAVLALLLAYMIGACVAVVLLLHKDKTIQGSISFGPFLALGGTIAALYGNQLLERFVGL